MNKQGILVENPKEKPYLTSGYKLYMIGGQNGTFPEHGEHLPYEMWGIWAPPIKLFNGFWFNIDGQYLEHADTFEMLPYGAKFHYSFREHAEIERFQFVPQNEMGFLLQLKIKNISGEKVVYPIKLSVQSNLMPVWLSERAGIKDGADYVIENGIENGVILKDSRNPWSAAIKCSEAARINDKNVILPVVQRENKNTKYCELLSELTILPNEEKTVIYWFAASEKSVKDTCDTLYTMETKAEQLWEEKIERYEQLEKHAALSFEKQPLFQEMYRWTQYINDWIIQDVDGVGKGVVAGYPEFPWWFGNDTNYIIPALLVQGETEICKSTLRLLKKVSEKENQNGRVVHEISSNGIVYYEGMTTETPQFADSVWTVYNWTGDYDFLVEMYDFCVAGMDYVESISVDGLPTGYGISEIAGLDCICCDTAVLAIRGYEVLSLMSRELLKEKEAQQYFEKYNKAFDAFQKMFYLPALGHYGDMAATKEEIIPRAETWKYTLQSFPITEEEKIMGESSCKKDKSPEDALMKEVLKKRMEQVIEEAAKMEEGTRKAFHLFALGHSSSVVEYGYLCGEEARNVLRSMEENYNKEKLQIENMMPIGAGRKIMAYGYAKEPKKILESIGAVAEGFSRVMPGATNEIYPDAGCFVQSWNSLATMWPYANSIFGIKPNAHNKTICLDPCVCEEMEGIKLSNVSIGGAAFDFNYTMENAQPVITVKRPDKSWKVMLKTEEDAMVLRIEE